MAPPSPARWEAIAPVLDEALDLAPERRAAFVAERCGSDHDLRREVERLLQAGERAGTFLEDAASQFVSPLVRRIAREERLGHGDRLGAYLIQRELGQGGMAVVYLARDTRHDRLVALKVLDRELSFTLGGDRFARETAIAARLNHPHILPLFDSGAFVIGSSSVLYYAMPHVEGRSLRERLRDEPRLSLGTAVSLGCQIAAALDHAHEHGVVHRDVKPENVLLSGEHAFVADFGIALALDAAGGDRLTRTGLSLGTPAYMSPEQATTGRLDGRSDLYSLGCVVYEMLAGQPPFVGPSAQAILAQHTVQPVPPLRELRPGVSAALEAVVMRALAKRPDDRFPTCAAFADALAAVPPGGSARGSAASALLTSTGLALRRHRRLTAVLVAIAAGATAAAVALGHGAVRGDTLAPDRAAVALIPFKVSADASLGYLREGIVDLLATRLGGTEIMHPVESRVLVSAWRRMGRGDDLTERQALALAGAVGAARVVEGEVVGGRSRVTLSSALLDVRDRRTLARETVEGPADSIGALLDRLAVRLLVTAAGEDQDRTATLAGTPLPAVRAYLDGQALDRRGLADSAARRFAEAVRADSTFSLAALRLVQTTPWPDVEDAARESAWRYRERLSVPDRANLAVTLGPRYPEPSYYGEIVDAAEHYVQVAPDEADAWYRLGTVLLEDGTLLGVPEVHGRASAAFARAAALDSTSVPILQGLTNAATVRGDTAAARSSLARLRAQQRDSSAQVDFNAAWFLAASTGDSQAVRRVLRIDSITSVLGSGRPVAHAIAMMQLGLYQGLDLRDVDGVLDRALAAAATETQRREIRWNQGMLDQIRGRSNPRPVELHATTASARGGDPILGPLFADADSAGFGAAGTALVGRIGSRRADECCIPRFAAGQYALVMNRLDLADRATADLLTYHGPSSDDEDSASVTTISHAFGVILRAQIAARRGDPSAATRLGELDSLLTDPLDASWWLPALGNLISARLHEARGEPIAALIAIRRRMWGLVCPYFVVYHREEGRLAALAGDTTGAVRAYRRYLALRGAADPPLQARVQEVRRALAALERGGAAP
jgi:TolB-like protein